MAIARDASTQVALGASPRTGSHTCAANAVLFVGTKGASGYSDSVTYNGVSLTRIANNISNVGEYYLSLFVIANPSSGTNTISVTNSAGTLGFTSSSYTGANTSSQPGATNTGTASSATSITTSVTTTVDNSWLVGYFSSSNNTLTASTGTSFVQAQANNVALGDSNGAKTPTGSYSMKVDAGSGTFASIIAELKVASSTTIKTWDEVVRASVKTLDAVASASIKTINGIT